MKRLLLSISLALLAFACTPVKDDPSPSGQHAPEELTLSAAEFLFSGEGGNAVLVVTGPKKPILTGVPTWLSVTEGEYADYSMTLTLVAGENDSEQSRESQIIVTSGKFKSTFTVSQEAGEKETPIETVEQTDEDLTNAKAASVAKNVYAFLRTMSGQKMLSGIQSGGTANNNDALDRVFNLTGKHPAVSSYDFIFLQYSPTPAGWSWKVDYGDISAAKEHWNSHGLVSYMWHWNVPTSEQAWQDGKNGNYEGYGFYSKDTAFDINRALTEGTWENEFILADIKKVAGYLKLLKDEGIPVIWRPLHEAAGNYDVYGTNGAWFWWGRGGAEPCKKLWKLLRDKLEGEYGLDNLVWVWTLDATQGAEKQYSKWYPGNDLVDIVGVDIYADDTDAKQRQYDAAVALSGGHKMVTISECGNVPDPAKCLGAKQAWSWFLVWDFDSYKLNTENYWKTLMASSAVVTREGMPSLK